MIRKFKPGDRVQKETYGPVMEVVKYIVDESIAGENFSTRNIECVWFENEERKKGVFDQRTLFKVTDGQGLYKD